jgi:hypothetical protein
VYLKAKEKLWKLKYFIMQKISQDLKYPSKKNQNPSRYYYNSIITNLKFQHKPKISSFKNPHIKIDLLLLLPRGPKSLKLLYSIINLNTISLPTKARPIKKEMDIKPPLNLKPKIQSSPISFLFF